MARRLRLDSRRKLARSAARSERPAPRNPCAARGGECLCRGNSRPYPPLAGSTRARNAGAPTGGRQRTAGSGRALFLLFAFSPRRSASDLLSSAPRRRQGDSAARRRCARRGQCVFPSRRGASFAGPSQVRLERGQQGLGNVRDRRARRRRRNRLGRPRRERRRGDRLDARLLGVPLYITGRKPSSVPCDAASFGLGRRRRRLHLRGGGPRLVPGALPTRWGRRAFILVHGHDSSETHVVDLETPLLPPRLIAPRRPGLRYQPMDHGDVFYIKTNSGARDFEIVVAPAEAPVEANWRAFLPAKKGA